MDHKLTPSFGRRKARKLREQAQSAYTDLFPIVKLLPQQSLFAEPSQEVWLEIGFGAGDHMLEQLSQHPEVFMIGCEPFINGVANVLVHLNPKDHKRLRIWHEDVRYLLEFIPASYFSKAFILFPDPWPKKRHHRRRLITKEFMSLFLPTLKEQALLHVASDDASYVEQIQEVLYNHPHLILCEGPLSADPLTWGVRPQHWPTTRYEEKALAQGKKCAYMIFEKKKEIS